MKKTAIFEKLGIYEDHGIPATAEKGRIKIYNDRFGWMNPVLCDGNTKTGKSVYTWSMLATNRDYFVSFDDCTDIVIQGTCPCHCTGCYATKGNYNYPDQIKLLAKKTWIAYNDMAFLESAINAQILVDDIKMIRIHAAGDFFSAEYVDMWKRIIRNNPDVKFWTYTKHIEYESAFDEFNNANIVKSIVPDHGFNFGKCDYIIQTYHDLKTAGIDVFICRCGVDENQHCNNCTSCSKHKFVLFLEHSTGYKAKNDPLFPIVQELIAAQDNENI